MSKPRFYDWGATLTRSNADVIMVVGARGYGKTYGFRKQAIKSWIRHGWRFVEVVRHVNEIEGKHAIQRNYFSKLSSDPDLAGWVFKVEGTLAYIARKPAEDAKPDWQLLGYFAALSREQMVKKLTFANVRYILLDEAILEPDNPYHRYLPNEYQKLVSIVDSCTRERADVEGIKPVVVLLGNAVDLTNPYFAQFGITREPKDGYSWHAGKRVLLHYVHDSDYSAGKAEGTAAGRLLSLTRKAGELVDNRFSQRAAHLIAEKTPNAKLEFALSFEGRTYGLWCDASEGYYYVTRKVPSSHDAPVFALTNSDMEPNYIMISRVKKRLQGLVDMHYLGLIKYDDEGTRQMFLKTLSLLGVQHGT